MSKEKETGRIQVRTIIILAIVTIIGAIGIVYLVGHSGQGDYAGMNLDKYIKVGDYKSLEIETEDKDETTLQTQVWQQLLEDTEVIKYPKKQVKTYYEKNLEHYQGLADDYGYETFEDYVKNEFAIEVEVFEEQLNTYAESEVKNDMLVYAIAEKEQITISEEEYAEFLENALKETGLDRDEFEELYGMSIEDYGKEKNLQTSLLQTKVMQCVVDEIKK